MHSSCQPLVCEVRAIICQPLVYEVSKVHSCRNELEIFIYPITFAQTLSRVYETVSCYSTCNLATLVFHILPFHISFCHAFFDTSRIETSHIKGLGTNHQQFLSTSYSVINFICTMLCDFDFSKRSYKFLRSKFSC